MNKFISLGAFGLLIIVLVAACTAPAQNPNQANSIQESLQITVYKSPT